MSTESPSLPAQLVPSSGARSETRLSLMPRSGVSSIILLVTWLACIGLGMSLLWRYQFAAGPSGQSSATWPSTSQLPYDSTRHTLLMFAHPRCPCTRASLSELEQIMSDCHGLVSAYVVFIKPAEFVDVAGWEQTDLWRAAVRIPGVQPVCDTFGEEALRFGVATSGQTLLYDPHGQLEFQGGITGSRGHCGINTGRSAVTDLITTGAANTSQTQVFGCALGVAIEGQNHDRPAN